jgi:hypothetical protein
MKPYLIELTLAHNHPSPRKTFALCIYSKLKFEGLQKKLNMNRFFWELARTEKNPLFMIYLNELTGQCLAFKL